MTNNYLHIVCFDVPYPVSHGGFFDLFYKIKTLHQSGVKIYLHCFDYGRGMQPRLEQYCESVYYYKRKSFFKSFSFRLPYIVASRMSSALISNLSKDQHPILLEGTHCTGILHSRSFPGRVILYRLHNIEHVYYYKLYKAETNILKKLYYYFESQLLKSYEKKVAPEATAVLTVAPADNLYFKKYCPKANSSYLPVFLPYQQTAIKEGIGDYCLYHGNLSIAENEQAALWLVQQVFHQPNALPLVIAGRQPSHKLQQAINENQNIQLLADPPEERMQSLIQDAHVNIVISFNATGIKLKLINALFMGRHCLVNAAAVKDTGLEACCTIADTATTIQAFLKNIKGMPFTTQQIEEREKVLMTNFSNKNSADRLIQYWQM